MSRRILVAGAINTDLVATVDRAPEAGETITGRTFGIHSGGKGANQAVAASRSGADVVMLGAVGNDGFGMARIADLRAEGIDTDSIVILEEVSSGVALITVESSGENRICYVPGVTRRVEAGYARNVVEDIEPAMILAANELPVESLLTIFRWAKANGVPVVYNAAPYSDDADALLRFVDVLIVNEWEAAALTGMHDETVSPEQLAGRLHDVGVPSIVVTLGGDGACITHNHETYREPALHVDVVDTTGAGDTFCGAFAARLLEGELFRQAVRYAAAAGALATTKPGAQSSIPRRDDIERLPTDSRGDTASS